MKGRLRPAILSKFLRVSQRKAPAAVRCSRPSVRSTDQAVHASVGGRVDPRTSSTPITGGVVGALLARPAKCHERRDLRRQAWKLARAPGGGELDCARSVYRAAGGQDVGDAAPCRPPAR